MEIYLIRHTSVEAAKGLFYGHTDVALKDSALEEIQAVYQKLAKSCDLSSLQVISSPATRCTTLAKAFTDNFVVDSRLWELNFGDWEMKSWNELPSDIAQTWMADFVNINTPNGESFKEMSVRIISFLEEMISIPSKEPKILTIHAGVIRVVLCYALGMDLKNAFRIDIDYGSISKLVYNQGYWSVKFINH